ncbi:uncharacterized protein TrAFT101_001402 [Trichoderma asperellum]|uniref:uncharacterized protein n=1 Tax=Trichoderma asperellum TaxID=101201 RepID=UPI0033243394|nr:hypothetical protein TrAFT101_001402 [Trichoderma asperellum]
MYVRMCVGEYSRCGIWRGRGYVDRRGIRRCTSNMCNRRDARDIDMQIWDDDVQKDPRAVRRASKVSLEGEYRPELRVPLSGNAATTAALPTPEQTALQRQNRPQAIISTAATRMPLQVPAALV